MKLRAATITSRAFFLIGLGLAIWLVGGFFRFADNVVNMKTPEYTIQADGIVSLTGGSKGRLTEGVKLLEMKRGKSLLISGVYQGASTEEIRAISGGSRALYECCIKLGRAARDTIGNAEEIYDWAKANNYKTILVVTDNYHIERSMLEISNRLKDVKIIPHAVKASPYIDKKWWESEKALKGLLNEYAKLRAAQFRLLLGFDPRIGAF
ncbi:MAG: YdcF family protein [Caulobacterales bacterium]|nr:YdcF family protein [Caulobacterales bacterium]